MESNSLINALACKNNESPPIWFMRQAGRCLPAYKSLREKYSLMDLFHHPDHIIKVTKLPLEVLKVDAAILFSDILVILEAFNIPYAFHDSLGPIVETPKDIHKIEIGNVTQSLNFVKQAIQGLSDIQVPLLGFCGAPLTVASYLIEGGTSRHFKKTKEWIYNNSKNFHALLEKITIATCEYLSMQVEAGVKAIQIFDSWANILSYHHFQEYCLHYLAKILKQVSVPVILFCRGASLWASELASLSPSAISLDWNSDLSLIRKQIGPDIALQGNLDPSIFYASENVIIKEAERLLQKMKGDKGFIFNLGHGMLPDVSLEKIQILVNYVKNYS